jgi:hypothetical protein
MPLSAELVIECDGCQRETPVATGSRGPSGELVCDCGEVLATRELVEQLIRDERAGVRDVERAFNGDD